MTWIHWKIYHNKRTSKTCETSSSMKYNEVAFPKERSGIISPEGYTQDK